jgi:predicted DsbA family dithiol-disulfide isomerase
VSDIAAAKDYLADKFGISRTSMRSTKAILEQAAAHGIEFEGL